MIESADFADPRLGIPVFSLYGEVRRPTAAMMDAFDVLLVDLQDVGCRIYTFVTTLRYVLEAAAAHGKSVWVLDRPNPIGRPVEGLRLQPGWESFVGAGPLPDAPRPDAGRAGALVRHDARARRRVRGRRRWRAGRRTAAPGFGWPLGERAWVNPSPNAPNLWMARCYRRHGDARGHDALRGPRHHAPAGAVRRPRPRRAQPCSTRCSARAALAGAAAGCAPAGSSRPSTSTSAGSARACRFTSRTRPTTTPPSAPGACWRSR